MEAKLIIVGGDDRARQFELHLPVTIGRSRSTDVTLAHPLVSRRHCELFESAGCLMVRDLGSLNGTFVGEARLGGEPAALLPGERLTVGCVTLRADYEICDSPQADAGSCEQCATVNDPLAVVTGDSRRFDAQHSHRPSALRPPEALD